MSLGFFCGDIPRLGAHAMRDERLGRRKWARRGSDQAQGDGGTLLPVKREHAGQIVA